MGHGFDLHRLEPGYPLIVGGIDIPHDRGCEAHSDGIFLISLFLIFLISEFSPFIFLPNVNATLLFLLISYLWMVLIYKISFFPIFVISESVFLGCIICLKFLQFAANHVGINMLQEMCCFIVLWMQYWEL